MTKRTLLRLSITLFAFLCLPASVSSHTRSVRLCIARTSGGSTFGQIGQEELTNSVIAKQKPAVFIIPVKLKAPSAAEIFDEARQSHCEYVVMTEIFLDEISTWSRPVMGTAAFFNVPYFRLQMAYKVYRLGDLKSIGRGSVASDGLNQIQDVVHKATDRLSRRILTDVNRAGVEASKQQP